LEPTGDVVVDRRRAQHTCLAEAHEDGAGGELGVVALEGHGTELVVGTTVGAGHPPSFAAQMSYDAFVVTSSTGPANAARASASCRSGSMPGWTWVSSSRRAPASPAMTPAWRPLRCCTCPSYSTGRLASSSATSMPLPSAVSDHPGPVSAL